MEIDMTREEAIKELRGFIGQLTEGCQEAIKVLIPELAESEDERTRPTSTTRNRQRAVEEMSDKTLDEAAEEYAYNNWEDNDYHTGASEGLPFDAIGHTANCFKSGARWMAGQGVTREAVIGMATKDIEINVSQRTLDALGLGPGDKVIVQIRKKEESK